MNNKFFSKLCTKPKSELDRYANALDWFFSEDKFKDNWDKTKAGQFTNQLKTRLSLLDESNGYQYKNVNPFATDDTPSPVIQHLSNKSEGKDFVKHIRNGIAHGRAYIKFQNLIEYIILTDYNIQNVQTAFMYMPLEYLLIIHEVYKSVVVHKDKRKAKK